MKTGKMGLILVMWWIGRDCPPDVCKYSGRGLRTDGNHHVIARYEAIANCTGQLV
jgi:hypothetical protein